MKYRIFQVVSTIVWTVFFVTDFMLFVFFNAVQKWDDSIVIGLILLLMLIIAWILQMIDLFAHRKMLIDERMNKIQHKSSTQTLMIVLVYMILLTMFIKDLHEATGFMSTKWLYFIASSNYLLALAINSILYLKAESDGEHYGD